MGSAGGETEAVPSFPPSGAPNDCRGDSAAAVAPGRHTGSSLLLVEKTMVAQEEEEAHLEAHPDEGS